MKNLLFIIACVAISLSSAVFAQKPEAGGIGISFSLTGFGASNLGWGGGNLLGTVNGKYILNNKIAVRTGLIFSSTNKETVTDTPNAALNKEVKETITEKGSSLGFSPGIELHFQGTNKLDPYWGVSIGWLSTSYEKTTNEEWLKDGAGTIKGDYQKMTENPGKVSTLVVSGVLGFNYFFADLISLGGEFGFGVSSVSTKDGSKIDEEKKAGTVSPPVKTNAITSSAFSLAPNGTGAVVVSVYFK